MKSTPPSDGQRPTAMLQRAFSLEQLAQAPESPSLPVPALLPPFEPLSSSPFRNPLKRSFSETKSYPTPQPTSSLGLPSSPPVTATSRPGLNRTISTLSERAPLASVPSISLPADGEPVLFGRSSNSSDYQLSANRLISRIHLKSYYVAARPLQPAKLVIECLGWNGAKIHSRGQVYEQKKGDVFTSESEGKDVMIDVQDCRVMVSWPVLLPMPRSPSAESNSTWNDESPSRRGVMPLYPLDEDTENLPPRKRKRASPGSPSYQAAQHPTSATEFFPSESMGATVVIYEDEPSDEEVGDMPVNQSMKSIGTVADEKAPVLHKDDFFDNEEENDPIITSFGPQGDNLLPRMATFTTDSPVQQLVKTPAREVEKLVLPGNAIAISNHVINQLAYSRLASTPLSTLLANLPTDLREPNAADALMTPTLALVLDTIDCVGEIKREGKDAAGKPLESEYYYIPDADKDQLRRDAVQGLKKPSLRACRKTHKQYFWKKPKN